MELVGGVLDVALGDVLAGVEEDGRRRRDAGSRQPDPTAVGDLGLPRRELDGVTRLLTEELVHEALEGVGDAVDPDVEEALVSTDPPRVRATYRYEGDTLRLAIDESLAVVATERES